MTAALRLVPPAKPTKAQAAGQRLKAKAHADALVCGCGSTLFVELLASPMASAGRVKGGTKRLACASCWVAGRLVVI